MLVTIAVAAILFGLLGTVISSGVRNYFFGREQASDDSQARLAIERMARELRTVRSATATDLVISPSTQITFTDVNGNTIVYQLSAGSITRAQNGGSAQPLVDNVTSLGFSYLQNDGVTAAASAAQVYYITVQFALGTPNVNATYRTTVKPFNF